MTLQEKRELAQKINEQTQWDGVDILDVLQIALEDANFHTLNKRLSFLRTQEELETQEDYCINI